MRRKEVEMNAESKGRQRAVDFLSTSRLKRSKSDILVSKSVSVNCTILAFSVSSKYYAQNRLFLLFVLDPYVYFSFLRQNVFCFKNLFVATLFVRYVKINLLELSNINVSQYDNIEFFTHFV